MGRLFLASNDFDFGKDRQLSPQQDVLLEGVSWSQIKKGTKILELSNTKNAVHRTSNSETDKAPNNVSFNLLLKQSQDNRSAEQSLPYQRLLK